MKTAFLDLLTRMQQTPNYNSPSAYDTAWAAWLYSEAREWIIDAQRPDGSWGAELEYYHDRVITTLAAINAIAATSSNGHDLKRIERGISYLEKAIPRLEQDVFETVAFELLLPILVNTGQELGLKMGRIRELIEPQLPLYYQKLALIPKEAIYSPAVAVAHSLEFLGFGNLDHGAIPGLRSSNGSIHNSPSATTFVEIETGGSVGGRAYLDELMKRGNGTVPGFAPFELFEIIWVLHHISLNTDLKGLRPAVDSLVNLLAEAWTKQGVGFSKTFLPDPDDTSLALRIMHKFGIHRDPTVLEAYEVGDHFQCFPLERNISLDVHIHIVHALKNVPDFPRRDDMLLKALNILGRDLTTEFIVDKWHISPYYSTAHVIIGLIGLSDNIIVKQIDWLLKTQRDNGSWTFYPNHPQAAIEETAYALMALMTVHEKRKNIPLEMIDKGFRYLADNFTSAEVLPEFWIDKTLYNPYYVVEAAILSAMAKYKELIKNRARVAV